MRQHHHGRGSDRRVERDIPSTEHVVGWLQGRLPDDWFTEAPDVRIDREEIIVIGTLAEPAADKDASDDQRGAALAGRIKKFREDTRDERIKIALELEHRTGQKVAWGARCGDRSELFTTIAVPVMTRLRQPERQVLDTLVDAGVARSRSEAVAWCVALVGKHTDDWLQEIRDALSKVDEVRTKGPGV